VTRPDKLLVQLSLLVVLLAVSGWAFTAGAVKIPWREFPDLLSGRSAEQLSVIFWDIRVPRVLLGILIGATLSVAGALMQGLFRNPLADPGLLGVSSGAALGAVFIIVLGGLIFPAQNFCNDLRFLPLAAFFGALGISLLIALIARNGGITSVPILLLAGVAINALVGSAIGFATFYSTDQQLRTLSFWTLGSLGGASWQLVGISAVFCLPMLALSPLMANALNAFALGEANAGLLGFHPEKMKKIIILLVSIGVGCAVALTGTIGFVGLVVPHLVRLISGPEHRGLLIGSGILGAILLVLADTLARTFVAPAELPIGIVTSVLGAPFFLWLLWRQRRSLWNT
jgi:iron complex transport system permease protein